MKFRLIILLFLLGSCSVYSQYSNYEIYGLETKPWGGPYFVLTLDTLQTAQTLDDLYPRYPSSWIRSYNSVSITTICDGETKTLSSSNDQLTAAQIDFLKQTNDCNVEIKINYIPENTLKYNPAREMTFFLNMIPIYEAKYPGGFTELRAYLKTQIVDEIPKEVFDEIKMAKARFKVTTEGKVTDVRIIESSESEAINQLILKKLCNMQGWKPAETREGQRIPQEFEFYIVGTVNGC